MGDVRLIIPAAGGTLSCQNGTRWLQRDFEGRVEGTIKKAFTLRIMRCLLIGIGAFVMILALKIRIRSGVDVAGYVLGAGGLWYIFEMIVIAPKKTRPPTEVEKQFHA